MSAHVNPELTEAAQAALDDLMEQAANEAAQSAWDEGYRRGYRDRSQERRYDLGSNPYITPTKEPR